MVEKYKILHAKMFLIWKRKTKLRFTFPAFLENVNAKTLFFRNPV